MFTDGAPGCAHTTWYNTTTGKCNLTHSNTGTAQITALTVLSAALMKDRLNAAYESYNGKTTNTEWFNIGLGVSDNENGTLFLNPKDIETNTSSTARSIRSYINTYTTGQYATYSSYGTNYVYTEHSYLANSGDALKEAFKELADKVETETKTITFPIVSTKDTVGDLVFTDVLGEGLKAEDVTLYTSANTYIKGNATGNVYTFNGYEMTAELSTDEQGRQVLTWIIPAKEMAIFSFANRQDPSNGHYNAAEPIRLCYDAVVVDSQNYDGSVIYSNQEAKAEFTISKENPYYHEEDGSPKTDVFDSQAKTENLTDTDENYLSFVTSGTENIGVTVKLGNNGVLKPVLQLHKDAESDYVEPNTDVSYILEIKNVGNETVNNVKVTDTLPADLSYKAGSSLVIEPSIDGQVLNFVIPKIEAGQTFTINYKATLSADAENFKKVINTAAISEIHTIEVYNPVTTTSIITVQHFYKVNYKWSGNIPSGVTLPSDAGRYTTGEGYSVDQHFTNQTKIENKDAYNNVIERWTFSGWSDPNAGIMGESDVTIPGVWSYESFNIPANKVIYTWSGDIPENSVLPNDTNTYVKNQPYSVDSTFTSQTVIPVYDAYNNLIGRYSFSGWADPNNGVMGETDITIPGVWRYESVTVEDYIVTYVWSGDIPNGVNLPLDENRYVPNQNYSVDNTYNNQTSINDYDTYGNICGYWSFSGWTDPNNGVMGHSNVTIEGVWKYNAVIVPDYKVTYIWSGDIPNDVKLPVDENSYVPNEDYSVDTAFNSQTLINDHDQYGNVCGKWTFSGWTDPNNGVMGNADVEIVGVWSYESVKVPTHKVIYSWSGDIPENVVLPKDVNEYVQNQPYQVDTKFSSQTLINDYDKYGNICGKWTFSGWSDPNNGVMGNEDVTIPGVWNYETVEVATHKVIYTWSGDIPKNVVLPTDTNTYVNNQPYNVDATFTNQTVINDYDKYGNVCGKWTFSGWNDPNNGVMGNADVTIPGVWSYETVEVATYKVIYTWSGDIPQNVVLPTDTNTYVNNQPYTVDAEFTDKTVINDYDAYGNLCGNWSFSGWTDPNNGVMGNADITIPGVWKYTAIQVPDYKVIYSWSGDIPNGVILPTDSNKYVSNQSYLVNNTYTAQTVIEDYDAHGNVCGKWTFSGWTDPNNGVMGNADVTILGVWEYTPIEVPKHMVIYFWSGEIPNGVTLPTDSNKYVNNQPYLVDNSYVSQTVIIDYDVYGNVCGKWTFSGWTDPNNGVMGNADVIIPGVWKYETVTVPDYKVIYNWSGDIPLNVTLPTDSNRYVNNQPYVLDNTHTSQTVIKDYDKYGNVCGKWSFSGWTDPNNGVMGNADVTVEGVWQYTTIKVPDYKVIYSWSGDIPNNVIIPLDNNRYVPNQNYLVDNTFNNQTSINDYDQYGNICGYWSFSGWTDPNNGVMGNANITIEGVWVYTAVVVPDYKVTYIWSGDIPEGVTLPLDENRYVTNQPYVVDANFSNQTTINDYDKYGNVCGKWSFSGWTDPNNGVMGNADVTVSGVWHYEASTVTDYKVIYIWSGEIPEGVTLPLDENRYVPNQPYTVDDTFSAQTNINDYDEYGNICGSWTFSGWTDPNNGVMGNADVTIEGVWQYTARVVPSYKVIYVWSGDIPKDSKLPFDENLYVTNQTYEVDSTFSAQTVINDYDENGEIRGHYTFSGWTDPNNKVMGNADVEIVGVWKYEKIQKPDNSTDTPPLGDNFHIESFILLFITSLITLIVLTIFKKKRVRI